MESIECVVCTEPMVDFATLRGSESKRDHRPVIICGQSFHKICRVCRDYFLRQATPQKCPVCRAPMIRQQLAVDFPYAEMILEKYLRLVTQEEDKAGELTGRGVVDLTTEGSPQARALLPSIGSGDKVPPRLLAMCKQIPAVRVVSLRDINDIRTIICDRPSELRTVHDLAGFRFARLVKFPGFPTSVDVRVQFEMKQEGLFIYMVNGYVNENLSVAIDLKNAMGSRFIIDFIPEIAMEVRGVPVCSAAMLPKVRDIFRVLLLLGLAEEEIVKFIQECSSGEVSSLSETTGILQEMNRYCQMIDFNVDRMRVFMMNLRKAMDEGNFNFPLYPMRCSKEMHSDSMGMLRAQIIEWMRLNGVVKVLSLGGAAKKKNGLRHDVDFIFDKKDHRFYLTQVITPDLGPFESTLHKFGWRRGDAKGSTTAERKLAVKCRKGGGSCYYISSSDELFQLFQFLGLHSDDTAALFKFFGYIDI